VGNSTPSNLDVKDKDAQLKDQDTLQPEMIRQIHLYPLRKPPIMLNSLIKVDLYPTPVYRYR